MSVKIDIPVEQVENILFVLQRSNVKDNKAINDLISKLDNAYTSYENNKYETDSSSDSDSDNSIIFKKLSKKKVIKKKAPKKEEVIKEKEEVKEIKSKLETDLETYKKLVNELNPIRYSRNIKEEARADELKEQIKYLEENDLKIQKTVIIDNVEYKIGYYMFYFKSVRVIITGETNKFYKIKEVRSKLLNTDAGGFMYSKYMYEDTLKNDSKEVKMIKTNVKPVFVYESDDKYENYD
jgi:hypothetical protein